MKIHALYEKYKLFPVQVKASFWFLICSFLQRAISMITTPIFTRLLSPFEYGQLGVFTSWYGIISVIITLSLFSGVHTQGLVKFNEESSKWSSSLQGLTFALSAFWLIVYVIFHSYLNHLIGLSTIQMTAMLIMIWTSAVFNLWANEQRVNFQYRALIIITILVSIAKPTLGILLVLNSNDKVTARILGLVGVELVCFTWMFFIQTKKGGCFFSKEFWMYALRFNLPLIPHYLSQTVLNSADRIMIRNLVGESEAGIYNLAYSVASIMILFNTALSQTITPWMYQKIKERKEKDIARIAYVTMPLIAFVNLALILFAPEVVAVFAPESYNEAIRVIPPVAMSVFFMYCYDMFAKFAFYYEKTSFIMGASIVGAVLNIFLNRIFIRCFGYIAAGYTTLACFMIYSAGHYYFMNKVCAEYCGGVKPYKTKIIMVISLAFMASGFLIFATYDYPLLRYGIVFIVAMILVLKRNIIYDMIQNLIHLRK